MTSRFRVLLSFGLALLSLATAATGAAAFETGTVKAADQALFAHNMIPQIARLGDGRLMTVWTVTGIKDNRGRVVNAFSSDGGRTWSEPQTLIQDDTHMNVDPNILVDGSKVFVYCTRVNIPNRIDRSWTMLTHSEDNGHMWSKPAEVAIPRQYVCGKQHNALRLKDGTYAMGISWDIWAEQAMAARTEGEMNLTSGVLLSRDGLHWTLHGAIHAVMEKTTPGSINGLCEPSLIQLKNSVLLMILRSGGPHHYESRSLDNGLTWSEPSPSALVGHNTPTALWRIEQHPDEILAVWDNSSVNRWPLTTAISADGGRTWSAPRVLAEGSGYQVSYPGITQTLDGTLVAVWQQQLASGGRDIRWARFTRSWILGPAK